MKKFLSRKFILFLLTFALASIFGWFGKLTGKETAIIWLLTSIFYGLWNIIEDKFKALSSHDLKDVLQQITELIANVKDTLNRVGK